MPAAHSLPQSSASKGHGREQDQKPSPPVEHLSCPVKGMYRLLSLITEQGSSGFGNRVFCAISFHALMGS